MVEEESKTSLTLDDGEPIYVPHTEGVSLNCRFYKDQFPKKDELVVVQVQNISDMGAYVSLLEYNGVEGMVLMSELSRKRIRSVKRLIRVGRLEVVVVLRVDEVRGYIDLSKKRVSPEEIQRCENRFKKSKQVHTILRNVAQLTQTNIEILYEHIAWPLYDRYEHPYDAFCQAVTNSDAVFTGLTMSEVVRMQLTAVIRRRLTPQPVRIRADFGVICYEYEGVEAIRAALKAGIENSTDDCQISIRLIAPPLYVIILTTANKERGFATIEHSLARIREVITAKGGCFEIKSQPVVLGEQDTLLFDDDSQKDSGDSSDEKREDMDVEIEDSNTYAVNTDQIDAEEEKKQGEEEGKEDDEDADS